MIKLSKRNNRSNSQGSVEAYMCSCIYATYVCSCVCTYACAGQPDMVRQSISSSSVGSATQVVNNHLNYAADNVLVS